MSTLVITGPTGHIGSYLLQQWDWSAWDCVRLVDNFSTGRLAALSHRPATTRWELIEADICTLDWQPVLTDADLVLHFAAITDAESSLTRTAQVLTTNHDATIRLALACRQQQVKLFFPSTTSVYGPQADIVDESCTADLLHPQSPYAESKLHAEQTLQAMAATQGLQCWIARLGTIFGASPGMRFHTAVNRFVWQAYWGQPLSVWRTAYDQQRPYLGLADFSDALQILIRQAPADGTLYNIVTENLTVRQVTDTIAALRPATTVDFVDSPIMNQHSYQVLSPRIRALGFTPHASLRDAVAETLAWLAPAGGR